ncbi:heat shock protein GrpE [Mycoplasma haemofelis str. Langford 1]|uniref:Protein GrpE n=1 Tax=Mycoplasma haemofelis (strain Langford 1) TaxID=941640 RepID=E8ZK86_MYCHL|nr:nucleotide exchange factor GrpE [Mycoplasma haemofelis]CBY92052.1 heat shock protein GrpE [Mycoplasma haemofelis str. Langford 1]
MSKDNKEQKEEEIVEEVSELDQLKAKLKEWEDKFSELEKESNQRLLEFVEKKSKEASDIIAKKEEEISQRYKKELEEAKDYLYEKPLASLVGVISQFEAVIKMTVDPNISQYLVGFRMFLTQFNDLLREFSISIIEPKGGDEFDSSFMEATVVEKVSDDSLNNKVISVFSKGYRLKDRIIRLASVKVGKI